MPNPPNFRFSIDLDTSKSVAKQSEADLVQFLCKEGDVFKGFARDYLGLDERTYLLATNVVQPLRDGRRQKPGDIDVLFVPGAAAEQAIAIECKVVPIVAADYVRAPGNGGTKVPAGEFTGEEGEYVLSSAKARNRFQALRRSIEQVTALCELGFHQTYLCVIVAADMQARQGYNWFYRVPSDQEHREIIDQCVGLGLPEECGIVFVQITQPSEMSVLYSGGLMLRLYRAATSLRQTAQITSRVEQLVAAPSEYLENERIVDSYTAPHCTPTLHCVPGRRQLRWDD
ncbi:MAG: hypothetical protein JST22_05945 [Bacteroidetes bacterium]|nr:hypothetical protein [Bacteroidota bacterium]